MLLHTLPLPSPALRLFAWMADCLRSAIAPHTRADTAPGRLLGYFHAYLLRRFTRFAALHAAWRAGHLDPPRTRAPRPRAQAAADLSAPLPRLPLPRLPRAHCWLIRQVQLTAIGQGQLQAILADPDIAAFLAAVPRAARIIRPLCTAVGLDPPPALRPPPRRRAPRRPVAPPAAAAPGLTRAERHRLRNYRPGPLRQFRKLA